MRQQRLELGNTRLRRTVPAAANTNSTVDQQHERGALIRAWRQPRLPHFGKRHVDQRLRRAVAAFSRKEHAFAFVGAKEGDKGLPYKRRRRIAHRSFGKSCPDTANGSIWCGDRGLDAGPAEHGAEGTGKIHLHRFARRWNGKAFKAPDQVIFTPPRA